MSLIANITDAALPLIRGGTDPDAALAQAMKDKGLTTDDGSPDNNSPRVISSIREKCIVSIRARDRTIVFDGFIPKHTEYKELADQDSRTTEEYEKYLADKRSEQDGAS